MDRPCLSTLMLLVIFSPITVYGEDDTETLACPEYQKAFEGSCYEFVTLRRSFLGAQRWCEGGGGHLVFVKNYKLQQFLQRHLQPEHNWWLGLASASFNLDKGPVSWLDGSNVIYSNWLSEPELDSGCGYISKEFQWRTTSNCSQEFFFICEFDLGHTLACVDHNAVLKCGSGQVIKVDVSFYGRNSLHYCRANHSVSRTSVQEECGWADVVDLVSGSCNGLPVCELNVNVTAFGEPCPQMGSYLSVMYHCIDASHLSAADGAKTSSQAKGSVPILPERTRRAAPKKITCQKLADSCKHGYTIKCSDNCGSPVITNKIVALKADPTDWTPMEWYIDDPAGNMVRACNSEDYIYLKSIGQGSLKYNVTNSTLLGYPNASSIMIVLKGRKGTDIGYGCRTIKLPTPIPPICVTAIPQVTCTSTPAPVEALRPFSITCIPDHSAFCCAGPCTYCIRTPAGDYVYCGSAEGMNTLYLPETSLLDVTIRNKAGQQINATVFVTVTLKNPPIVVLQDLVSQQISPNISAAVLAQFYLDVSNRMSGLISDVAKEKLLEDMMTNMCTALTAEDSVSLVDEIQVISKSILNMVSHEDALTPTSEDQACCVLDNIINFQITFLPNDGNNSLLLVQTASPIVNASSIILKVVNNKEQQPEIVDKLLSILNNVHDALLNNKSLSKEPTVIISPLINVYANRFLPGDFQNLSQIVVENADSAAFTLPSVVSTLLPLNVPVDVRMLSFKTNPFSWSKEQDIDGVVGSLSLTNTDGSVIPVENLSKEIEILLPRLEAANLTFNATYLDLKNYSTMVFNVTDPGRSLVLKMKPVVKTPLKLHLGFQYYPNDTTYIAKAELPQAGSSEDEMYTWVLSSKIVKLNVGVYYLLVRPIVQPGVNSSNASVYVTSFSASCVFWIPAKSKWGVKGCRVGPRTTPLVTQCLCNHLTFFGSSFFVMPNTVDVARTAELFSTFANNPVVMCFVGAIFLVYILAVIWAHKKDLQDKVKVKVTVLEDNDPLAEYRYLVAVTTGHRRGAGTTSHVTVTLTGTVWESKPHHLTDPEKPVFSSGEVDLFLLTTPFSLGDLQSIRLWHDNSGEHPDWYVNRVAVQDLETGQKWHFLCNSWLSIDMGQCTLDKTFHIATETELKGFHNLFFTKTAKDLCDGHIWYSVLHRPASSNFTRVQRLSCCFSLLLCTMVTSIMFWGIPTDPSEQDIELGTIKFSWQQVMIGIQSSLIMFPVNLLIVSIFRFTRPRKKKEVNKHPKRGSNKHGKKVTESFLQASIQTDVTMEVAIKDLKRIVRYLSKVVEYPVPKAALESETTDLSTLLFQLEGIIRQKNFSLGKFYSEDIHMDCYSLYRKHLYKQLLNLEKELRLLGPSQFPKPEGYLQSVMQVQGMKHMLQPYLSSTSDQVNFSFNQDNESKRKCCPKGLPWWFVIVGWILVAATSGVSVYFTMMYGLTYGKERSISWLISITVSFFESLFITQPIKVLGFAVFFALVIKSVSDDETNYFKIMKDMRFTYTDDPDDVRISRRDSTSHFYQPPPAYEIEKMKINRIKNQKASALIWEIIIYLAFLCVLLVATYGQRDPNAYFLSQHIDQSFRNGISDSMSPGAVFTWARSVLLNNLFGQRPGFITDGNSKLVGSARLRQVRVHNESCKISAYMQHSVPDCHAPYSWDVEDTGSYGPGWSQEIDANTSKTLLIPWQYQTQSKLRGHPIWGNVAFYRGGGFVLDLGLDQQHASSMLQYLYNNTWMDEYTRAIFVEFTVYNANVNLFCIVTLMLETTAVGGFQYRSELQNLRLYQTTDGINILASEIIYFVFILYYMFMQAKQMKRQKCGYFRCKWNLLELAIILLSWSAAGAIVNRTIQGDQDLKYFQEHKDQFPSFYDTALADSVLGYILAFLILLATIKMWHLMRLNSKLNLITCTLKRAWKDISNFIVIITIMLLAYSLLSSLLFGWKLYTYKTVLDAASAIVSLQLGIFNYDEVLELSPVLGAFIVVSCIIFMTFVVLNLFISVILEAFSQEQKHHKPSEEEEIVDLMLLKICKTFRIHVKKKQ